MRVIVTGCRDWTDRELVWEWLAKLPREGLVIVHGGCPTGADKAADEWAILNTKRGPEVVARRDAGPNMGMVNNRDKVDRGARMCLMFWDAASEADEHSDLLDMVTRCVKARIPVRIVPPRLASS